MVLIGQKNQVENCFKITLTVKVKESSVLNTVQYYDGAIFCQICIPIVNPQVELRVFKVIKLDMQIRPVFADSVTYILAVQPNFTV